jgi:hypothetical protein
VHKLIEQLVRCWLVRTDVVRSVALDMIQPFN